MNVRLFFTIFSFVMSIFLFIIGSFIVFYISYPHKSNANKFSITQNKSIFGSLIEPIVQSLEPITNEIESISVLVMGGDTVNKNTDTVIVANLNFSENTMKLLSIPRDTKITAGGSTYKINSAYPNGGGKKALISVDTLLNMETEYYLYVDTKTFRYIIDTLGGVQYMIPEDMYYDDPVQNLHIHLKKGLQLLNGKDAEGFMRFRQFNNGKVTKFYDGSDMNRIKGQQGFIAEFIKQKVNVYSIAKFKDILNIVLKNIETNFTLNDIIKVIKSATNLTIDDVEMFTLPGMPKQEGLWYYIPDDVKTKELITQEFILE